MYHTKQFGPYLTCFPMEICHYVIAAEKRVSLGKAPLMP